MMIPDYVANKEGRGQTMTRQEVENLIEGLTEQEKNLIYELLLTLKQNPSHAESDPAED